MTIRSGLKFRRVCRVILGKTGSGSLSKGLSFDNRFRIEFEVTKTIYHTPNAAVVKIYNLSQDTLARITSEFDEILISAGYESDPILIFRGNIKYRYQYREVNDHIIELDAGDGDKAYRNSTVNFTMAAQSTESQAIDHILSQMPGVSRGYIAGSRIQKRRSRGKTYSGTARELLTQVSRDNDAQWSILDGKLVLVPVDSTLPLEAIKVSSLTGLLETPEINDKGISIKMMLEPRANPNGKLWLQNNEVKGAKFKIAMLAQDHAKKKAKPVRKDPDGVYKMFVVVHKGDTRGREWTTSVKCIGLQEKIPTSKGNVPMSMEDGASELW